MNFFVRNYLWPAIYAIASAVLAQLLLFLNGEAPFDGVGLAVTAGAALLAFIGPRLQPYAGPREPFIEPHKPGSP